MPQKLFNNYTRTLILLAGPHKLQSKQKHDFYDVKGNKNKTKQKKKKEIVVIISGFIFYLQYDNISNELSVYTPQVFALKVS